MVAANMMSAGVRAIDNDAAVSEALKLFSEGIQVLAAVDKEGSAVGVITPVSIMRAVFKEGRVDGAEACKIMGKVIIKDALEEDFASVYPNSGIDEVRAMLTRPQKPNGVHYSCGRPQEASWDDIP